MLMQVPAGYVATRRGGVRLGLGRIVALYYRSSTSYQIYCVKYSVPLFLK